MRVPDDAALLLIDLQRAIDDPSWGVRNQPEAEARGARLLAAWRASGRPLFHVRHDSVEPQSTYRPGQPGHEFKAEFVPLDGEPVVGKQTTSAFVRTGLEERLRAAGAGTLVVFGVITNNSVETTVRHAACLGFVVWLVEDCTFTFGLTDWAGRPRTADEVHAMSLANLNGEYCRVLKSGEILEEL